MLESTRFLGHTETFYPLCRQWTLMDKYEFVDEYKEFNNDLKKRYTMFKKTFPYLYSQYDI